MRLVPEASRTSRGTTVLNDMTITFAIVAAIVVLFVWDRLPVVVVAMATALALWATGVLDLTEPAGCHAAAQHRRLPRCG